MASRSSCGFEVERQDPIFADSCGAVGTVENRRPRRGKRAEASGEECYCCARSKSAGVDCWYSVMGSGVLNGRGRRGLG
jgi:hypothetical protein